MKLSEINRQYETIIHSDISQDEKDRKLAKLMSIMEKEYKIPALKNKEWESENRSVISLYRKISMSRKFD